jgi:lipopolysaccharide/colanic/teichoic acid biosynthesis glycosyltransferase
MSLPTWIRSELLETPIVERLPERLPGIWSTLLLASDAAAAAIAVLLAGLPVDAVPAVCLLTCLAGWFVGGDHISFAARSRDECYHAIAAVAVAGVPILIVLAAIGGFSLWQSLFVLPFLLALLCPLHIGLHAMRYSDDAPDCTNDAVSPRAKRRVNLPIIRGTKRVIDAALSGIAVAILSPVMVGIAFAILRESGGPVFFTQERVGRDRHRFTIHKFRTMRNDADSTWAKPGDERITNVGAFLRRTSLDELPQLINVLKGEMSLVGPRPEMPEYAHEFRSTIPRYDDRVLVNPGMTGWAQVHLDRNLKPSDMAKVVPYDLFYVEHASFALDAYIAAKTLLEVPFHRAV